VSCGELGVGSDDVESKLSSALQLATKWNAIALIDEADVFLEQRSAHDLERNSLVSSKYFQTRRRRQIADRYSSLPSNSRVL
jgi:hypothetical protein